MPAGHTPGATPCSYLGGGLGEGANQGVADGEVGRFGDAAFEGAQGSVKVDEATSARITLLAGDVSVGRLGGSAEIITQMGDIHIAEAVRGTVVLRTESSALGWAVRAPAAAPARTGQGGEWRRVADHASATWLGMVVARYEAEFLTFGNRAYAASGVA